MSRLAVVGGAVIGRRRRRRLPYSSVRWCTHGAVSVWITRSSRATFAGGLRRPKCCLSLAGFPRYFVFIPFSTTTFRSVDAAFRACIIDQRRSRSIIGGGGGGGGVLRKVVVCAERVDDTTTTTLPTIIAHTPPLHRSSLIRAFSYTWSVIVTALNVVLVIVVVVWPRLHKNHRRRGMCRRRLPSSSFSNCCYLHYGQVSRRRVRVLSATTATPAAAAAAAVLFWSRPTAGRRGQSAEKVPETMGKKPIPTTAFQWKRCASVTCAHNILIHKHIVYMI